MTSQLSIQVPEIHITSTDATHRVLAIGLATTLQSGNLLLIEGPSACGKSLTLRYLAGRRGSIDGNDHILYPDASLRYQNSVDEYESFCDHPELAQCVPQDLAEFFITADVNLEIELSLELTGAESFSDKRREFLYRFDISDTTSSTLLSISHGQRQLVAIASALAWDPGVLFLDEPFAPLSKPSVQVVVGELRAFLERGGIVVLTSHERDVLSNLLEQDGATIHSIDPQLSSTDVSTAPQYCREWIAANPVEGADVLYTIDGGDMFTRDETRFLFSYGVISICSGDCILLEGSVGRGQTTFLEFLIGLGPAWTSGGCFRGADVARNSPIFPDDMAYCSVSPLFELAAGTVSGVLTAVNGRSRRTESAIKSNYCTLLSFLDGVGIRPTDLVTDLSYGQQRLVALARYPNIPTLFAIDEVPYFVDPAQQAIVNAMLSFYRDNGASLVLTCHRAVAIEHLCNKKFSINNGWLHVTHSSMPAGEPA